MIVTFYEVCADNKLKGDLYEYKTVLVKADSFNEAEQKFLAAFPTFTKDMNISIDRKGVVE